MGNWGYFNPYLYGPHNPLITILGAHLAGTKNAGTKEPSFQLISGWGNVPYLVGGFNPSEKY